MLRQLSIQSRVNSLIAFLGFLAVCVSFFCIEGSSIAQDTPSTNRGTKDNAGGTSDYQVAVVGGGCFWCIEAVFERVLGVNSVESGYAGGTVPNPTYEMVKTGRTGHAEVCRIEFDPDVISYADILRIFFKSHDPTLLNAQGPDYGTQYRSVILFSNEDQKKTAESLMEEFKKKRTFRGKVVTELAPLRAYYRAEDYHQDYFAKHPEDPYCEVNVRPKIGKFERSFKEFSKVQKAKRDRKEQKEKED